MNKVEGFPYFWVDFPCNEAEPFVCSRSCDSSREVPSDEQSDEEPVDSLPKNENEEERNKTYALVLIIISFVGCLLSMALTARKIYDLRIVEKKLQIRYGEDFWLDF